MVNYNINNKDYLLSIKPSYMFIPIIIFSSLIIIIISICYFKTYDVFVTKGYLSCDNKCNIVVSVNPIDINKINKANYIKLNDKLIDFKKIIIDDIQVDEINKINIQNVNVEVDQLDNDYLNTFQDIKVYSNYESIFSKIKKLLM